MAPSPSPQPLILYDGVCGLCHASVRWLMKRDRGRLRYAPLQGETASALRARSSAVGSEHVSCLPQTR